MEWLFNPLVQVILIFLGIVVFVKFAGWASKQRVSAGFKKAAFWLTGLGLVICNIMYAKTGGEETFHVEHGTFEMTLALGVALFLVFLFTYALMAEGPEKPEA